MPAFSSTARRFSVTTGTVPDERAVGVVFPDGTAAYRLWQSGGGGVYSDPISGAVADLVAAFGGQGGYALTYTDEAAVDAVSINPTTGGVAGGTSVTITGTGFLAPGLAVTIGGAACTNIAVNAAGTSITATTPARTAGAKDVVVTNAMGTDTLVGGFTYA